MSPLEEGGGQGSVKKKTGRRAQPKHVAYFPAVAPTRLENAKSTSIGYTAGEALLYKDRTRYVVLPSGSLVNYDKHLARQNGKLTKKQRAKLKKAGVPKVTEGAE